MRPTPTPLFKAIALVAVGWLLCVQFALTFHRHHRARQTSTVSTSCAVCHLIAHQQSPAEPAIFSWHAQLPANLFPVLLMSIIPATAGYLHFLTNKGPPAFLSAVE